jgi:hypothetical protein
MRAVCIARHRFLSDHISSVFREIGVDCVPVVGFQDGMSATRAHVPEIVICDYDLLVAAPLREWEGDPELAEVPIVAVSLTRRPEEAHLVDANGIAGFLYLPGIQGESMARVIRAATGRSVRAPLFSLPWNVERPEPTHHD